MYRRCIALGLLLLVGSGCTTVPASQKFASQPFMGQDDERIRLDREECEALAQANKTNDGDAVAQEAAWGMATSGAVGAAAGAILGAVGSGISAGGGALLGVALGGSIGLVIGIITGLQADTIRYERLYKNCMTWKNYLVEG